MVSTPGSGSSCSSEMRMTAFGKDLIVTVCSCYSVIAHSCTRHSALLQLIMGARQMFEQDEPTQVRSPEICARVDRGAQRSLVFPSSHSSSPLCITPRDLFADDIRDFAGEPARRERLACRYCLMNLI